MPVAALLRRWGLASAVLLACAAASAQETPENSPPTGAPALSGTARVGETLTAAKGTLADADGLPDDASLSWQWVRQDDAAGANPADIASATGTAYTLTLDDTGKYITVRVSYTDDGGTDENVTAAAMGPVLAPPLAPDNLRETARTADGFTIAWDAPGNTGRPDIAHYDVQHRTPPGTGTWTDGPQGVAAATTTATLAGLTAGTGYEVRARAANADGDGPWSAPLAATAGPPRIAAVAIASDPGDDKSYAIGDRVEVTVTFDTPVQVTGTPELALQVGANSRSAVYASGDGTAALVFAYTVQAEVSEVDADGIAIGANALSLPNGAAIANGIAATVTHDAVDADDAHRVDGRRPRLHTGNFRPPATSEDGARIVLSFPEAIRSDPAPNGGVTIRVAGSEVDDDGNDYVVQDDTVTIALASPVRAGQAVEVDVAPEPATGEPIRDLAGNPVEAVSNVAVTNNTEGVALVLTPASISENGGRSAVTATLKGTSNAATTLTVSVTPVSPATASDFTLSDNKVLTIAAGQTASSGTVIVTAVNNSLAAADKRFAISATIANEDGLAAPADVTLTIRNDDGGICDRTLKVQQAILDKLTAVNECQNVTATHLSGITGTLRLTSQGIGSLKTGDFTGLSGLEQLELDQNSLTTLPPGLLSGLSSLTKLHLARNQLAALPADLISGLSSLDELWLEHNRLRGFPPGFFRGHGEFAELHTDNNPGDSALENLDWDWNTGSSPVPIAISLAADDRGAVKVVAPSGVPFGMTFTITLTNGEIDGAATTFTLSVPGGALESNETKTVTRTAGTSEAVTADITRVPHHTDAAWQPLNHGFLPKAADDLLLEVFPAQKPQVGISPKTDKTTVTEGTAAEFILTRDAPHDDALMVTVAVAQTGSVIKTADSYEPPDSVEFLAGEGTATLTVETEADSVDEADGTITATVTAEETDDYTAGDPAAAEVTVQDNDKTTATVDSVSLTSDPGTDGAYAIGDTVEATVTFSTGSSGPVTVTGEPRLALAVGGETLTATYRSGSGSNDLVFAYTVAEGDADTDGIAVAANALSLNGGTIGIGEDAAVLTHAAVAANAAHKVDGVRPAIAGAAVSADGRSLILTYSEELDPAHPPPASAFTVTVDGNGRALGGAPTVSGTEVTLPLETAALYGQTVEVSYADPSAEDDADAVQDIAGNDAAALDGETVTNNAVESRVVFSSYAGRDRTYAIGDAIEVTRRFPSAVTVSGTPQLSLTIGDGTRPASYTRGSGTRSLVFVYTVAEGDADADGVSVAQDALSLNGGSIRIGSDDAPLSQGAVPAQARHMVDGVRPAFDSAETSADGRSLKIAFDKTLNQANEPSATPYRVYVDGERLAELTGEAVVSGAVATLDLPVVVTAGQTVEVALPEDSIYEPVRGLSGNAVAPFEKRTATNNAADSAGPRLKMAVLDKTVLTLAWDEALDGANPPPLGAFAVSVGGSAVSLTGSPAVSGSKVTLTLASAPAPGRAVAVSYTDPSAANDAAAVQDADGNDAASVANRRVMRLKRVTIAVTPATVAEGGEAEVTATLDAPASAAFTVAISAAPGADTQAENYELSATPTLSFAKGATESSGTVTLTAADNAQDDHLAKQVQVSGALGSNAPEDVGMLGPRTLHIVDDDPAPRVLLSLSADPLPENGGTVTVTAALDRPSSQQTTLTVQVAPAGSATADHFSVSPSQASHSFTFAAGGTSSTGSFTITAVDNDAASANRKLRLTGTVTSTNGVVAPDTLDLLIADDEGSAPAAPTGLTAAASGANVVLGWTAPSDTAAVTGYQLRWKAGTGSYGNWADIPDSAPDDANATGYTVTGLAEGVRHSFRVRAVGAAAAGAQSNEASATPGTTDRAAPVLSRAAVDWDKLTLTYGETLDTGSVPDAAAYEVTVGSAARTVREVQIAGSTVVLTLASPVAAGEPVGVTYTAPAGTNATPVQDAADNPASSLTGQVALNATPRVTLVLKPAAVDEDAGVSTVMATVWPAAARAFTVTVATVPERSEDFILSPNRRLSFAANRTDSTGTVTVTALDNELDAADAAVTVSGAVSAAARVTGPADVVLTLRDDDDVPGTPALTAASGHRFVLLAWTAPADAGSSPIGGYQYRRKAIGGGYGEWTAIPSSAPDRVNGTSFAVSGLTNGIAQVFQLRAVSAAGIGPPSAEAAATPAVNAAPEFPEEIVRRVAENSPAGTRVGAPVIATDPDGERLTYTLGGEDAASFAIDRNSGQITLEAGTALDYESDKNSYTVAVTAADPAGRTDTATVAIEVTDVAETHLDLHLDPASIAENGGVSTVSATLSAPAAAAFTVEVAVAAVSPAVDGDFTLSKNRTLRFAAGARSSSGTVTVTAVNNSAAAAHKSVTVSGTVSDGADVQVGVRTLTILDDDTHSDVCNRTAAVRDKIVEVTPAATCGEVTQAHLAAITSLYLNGKSIASLQSGDLAGLTGLDQLYLNDNQLTTLPADIFAGLADLDTLHLHNNTGLTLPAGVFAGLQLTGLFLQVNVPVTLERVSPGRIRAVVATGAPFEMTLPLSVSNGALPSGVTSVTIPAGRMASGTLAVTRSGSRAVSVDLGTLPSKVGFNGFSLVKGAGLPLEVLAASPRPVLVLSPATIPETGVATITAELDEPAPVAFDLTVSTRAGNNARSSNYRLSAQRTLRFAKGATESTGAVTVAGVDNDYRDHANKEVQVRAAVDGSVPGVRAPENRTLTLTDDDPPPVATLVLSDDSISEDGGTVTVTVRLDRRSTRETLVDVSVTPDSPATAGDFSLNPSTTPHRIKVRSWRTEGSGSLTITATDNAVDAADRTLTVSGTVESDNGVVAPADRTLRIVNDDASGRAPELLTATVEGTTVTLTWDETLDAANPPPLSAFSVSVGGTTASLTGSPAVSGNLVALTLAAAPAAGQTVTVTYTDPTAGNDDNAVQDAAGNDAATVTNRAVTRPKTVTLVLSPAEISENGVSTITATLDRASSTAFAVRVSATPLTAAASNYRLSAQRTLRFAANETASTGAVTIAGVDDSHDDRAPRTVQVAGTLVGAPDDVSAVVARTLTLADDDPPPRATLRLDRDPIPEGGSTTVTLALDRPSSEDTTVTVRVEPVAPATASDFTLSPAGSTKTFTVDAGSTAPNGSLASFDIEAVDNNAVTPNRKLRLIAEVTSENGAVGPDAVELFIQDDEGSVPGAPTGVSATPVGGSIVLAWTAPAESGGGEIAGYQIRHRPGTGSYGNWTDIPDSEPGAANTASYTLRGLAGGVQYHFQLRALNEHGAGAPADEVSVTLPDRVALVLDPATITESGGTTVTATLDRPASAPFSVTVSVSPGTHAPSDTTRIVTLSGDPTLRFSKGARRSTGVVTVSGVDNAQDDHRIKQILVGGALSGDAPDEISDRIAPRTLSITDDDPAPRARWRLTQDPLFEGSNKNRSYVSLELDRASSRDTTIEVQIEPIEPTTASDVQVSPADNVHIYSFRAWHTTSTKAVTVTAVNNDAVSPGRKLRLTAAVRSANGVVAPDAWELLIADDEGTRADRPAGLTAAPRDGAVWLAWSHPADPSPVTGYEYRAVPPGQADPGWFDIPDSAPGQENATGYLVSGLSNGVEYSFRVRTVAAGGGRGSNTVTATPVASAADPEVTVSYDAASYTATEGGSAAEVTVTLSEAPGRRVAIPIAKIYRGSASSDDYSGVPASLTFGVADTSKTFTVTATDDSVRDAGESLELGFGPRLPEGVTAGTRSTATVALADNDDGTANAAPTASHSTVTTKEDTAYTFGASDFNFSDTDTSDALSGVKIASLPANGKGTLTLDGTAIAAANLPKTVARTEIDANKLVYTPPANANGDDYATFEFKVNDGKADSASAYTMTVGVDAVNDPPTGKSAISGIARVGQTLTASTAGIADADGLSGVSYSYQWIRVDADGTSNPSDIADATAATYALAAADLGKRVKVKVSFADEDGTDEALTSDAYPSPGTVAAEQTFALTVAAIATDDKVNIAEKASGFAISGTTGSEAGVSVTVKVGTASLPATSAGDAGTAAWSVTVPAAAAYLTETSVEVTVSAAKTGYTAPDDVERTLTVDLTAPTAPTYAAPTALKVGAEITEINPAGGSGIDSYAAAGLPAGLTIASDSGAITGTPSAADANTAAATVTVSDAAGNTDTVDITFPAVTKGDQTLSGFEYSASTATFGGAAPTVTAPTGAETALSYAAGDASVCTVDGSSGELTLNGAGSCVITATAAGTDHWNQATATYTVTVQPAGTLTLTVAAIATDDKVNIAEKASGFAISGTTGSEAGVSVTVKVGTASLPATSAGDAGTAAWSVTVPAAAAYLTETSVEVTVSAAKTGYTAPDDVERTLTVDLTAPTAPTYAAPTALKVGAEITEINPAGGSGIDSYAAAGLPAGLTIASDSGAITGTPSAADANTAAATVTVSDAAGNTDTVDITFPAVTKGDQTLSGFEYSASTATFGGAAPTVTAPTGAETALSYAAGDASVCTVDGSSGELTLNGAGSCVITATAAGTDHWNQATATYTVTVQPAGTLTLTVAAIATDDKVNIAEKASGFAISGTTGSEAGVSVTVKVGTASLPATSAGDAGTAAWSVTVPAAAAYLTETSVEVTVSAAKTGYTAPDDVERTLTVDLTAPTAPTYAAPTALKVGAEITEINPAGGSGIDSYAAAGLPAGLTIASDSGAITGTPSAADANTAAATVTVSDAAGNTDTVDITFPAVTKGDQTLSGFEYSASTATFGGAAPTVTAPTGAETALSYAAGDASVCTVDGSSGELTLNGAGSCVITATAAGTDHWNQATATYTVTVQPAGTLTLTVAAIATDDKVNIAEKASGFAISGTTGSEAGVSVTVKVGTASLPATSAGDAGTAAWSVTVPAAAAYLTETSVEVTVSAAKTGYTAPDDVERTLTVDLTAPTAPTYAAPTALKVGAEITEINPAGGSGIDSYAAAGLPAGLTIASDSGAITGTPSAADANTAAATVTVSDAAGNTDTVDITFPAVTKGDQTLSGFEYSASTATFGGAAPTVTAPTGAETALSYAAGDASVCTVDGSSGELTLNGAGSCVITATAAGTDHWNQATATYTVTVQPAGTLTLTVAAIATDDKVNIAEKASGFAISGTTGSEAGVSVTVKVGTASLPATSAGDAGTAAWSVTVPAAAAYLTETSVEVTVSAAKTGYTAPDDVERTLTVDLTAPTAPTYAAPTALKVGAEITEINPAGGSGIDSYAAAGLPAGLTIASDSGAITGTPSAADANTAAATVTVSDAAGNTDTVDITFPAVTKGDQTLSGFEYSASTATFGGAAPTVTAPTGAETALSYAAGDASVCTVDGSSGELTLNGAGSCVITATAAGTDHWNQATATYTVTVQPAGTLTLTVAAIATDDKVNIAEKASGFAISGTTGSEAGVSVTVKVGTASLPATSAGDAGTAAWSVTVPAAAAYLTETSVEVTVSAAKTGYTAPDDVERTLTVDLTAPTAPTYAAPTALKVGAEITEINPAGGSGIDSYAAAGLPAGLTIASDSGAITGTPSAADANTAAATVTVSDAAGNTDTVDITFPAVTKGDQTLSGFEYSASTATFGGAAPTVTAPTGAETALSYAAGDASVCTVDGSSGELTLNGAGSCVITATAAGTDHWNQATATYTVTVQPAGTLTLTVAAIATDDKVNIAEKASGFAISGTTGSEAGVSVTVKVGTASLPATSAGDAGTAAWSVTVPAAAAYLTETSVEVTVSAAKTGYTAPDDVERTLTVDLTAPTAPTYAAPTALKVGAEITEINPAGGSGIDSYAAAGLPAGLTIASDSGAITGTPSAADANTAAATVTVSDAAGNTDTVDITFPAVTKGDQTLSGFEYSPDSLTLGDSAPTLTAPTVADGASLSYATSTSAVCAVNASSGALIIVGAGTCTVTVTAAATDNYGSGTRSVEVTVSPVALNAAPTASNGAVTTDEDTDYTFEAGDFGFSDTDTDDALASVKVTKLPGSGKGTLILDGTAIASNDLPKTVTESELDSDKLVYRPPANANGDDYATFKFKVNDGKADSATAYTMTVDVTPVNDVPAGAPEISGAVGLGQTLTALTAGISDADGLSAESYGYQWIRVDADGTGNPADIPGATSRRYVLQAADVGKRVKVKVSFTDDGGTDETLTSAAWPSSDAILAPPDPPTALLAVAGNAVVKLAWAAPENTGTSPVTGYQYQWKADGGSYGAWTATGHGLGVHQSVDGLSNATAYTFRVRAVNAVGAGPASDEATATPNTEFRPIIVGDSTAAQATTFRITVTFDRDVPELRRNALSVGGGKLIEKGEPASPRMSQPGGREWAVHVQPNLGFTGWLTVDIPAGAVRDTDGNLNVAAVQYRRLIKAQHVRPRLYMKLAPDPETGVVRDPSEPVSGPFAVDLRFTTGSILHQPVTGLTLDDIVITNGTKANLVQVRAGNFKGDYEVTVTPDPTYTGPFTITVEEGAAYACNDLDDPSTCDESNLSLGDTLALNVVAKEPRGLLDSEMEGDTKTPNSDKRFTPGRSPPRSAARGCAVEVTVRFRDADGDPVAVESLAASDFTVKNGRLGTPSASPDGLAWTVPARASPGFTGLMRVRLAETERWEAAEQAFRVAGDTDCAPVARNALASLALDGLDLDPAFDAATTAYTADAPADKGMATVTATAVYGASEVAVTPADVDEEADGRQVALAAGETEVTVTVTPGDGSAAKTYTVTVTREAAPSSAALSVADARAEEGTGATLDFAVTLDREAANTVTVAYATADGTAVAGSDYTATSGTLTFQPGETEKTVSVPVLEDDHDEGSETLTLRLSNAQGATISDGEATGTITNSGAIPQAWLARFGRTVTGQVLEAVEARLATSRQAGADVSLAGQALPPWRGGEGANPGTGSGAGDKAAAAAREEEEARQALAAITAWLAQVDADDAEAEPESRALTERDFITGTSFALTGGGKDGGGFASLWGRASIAGFDGREGSLTVDGEVTTGLIGADWASDPGSGAGRWTAGLALGHSIGTGGWRGANGSGGIAADLTGFYPYAGVELTERLSLWAAAGYGAGEVMVTPDGEAGLTADLAMAMGAAGVRSDVLRPEDGDGLALAVKSDARFARMSSEAVRGGDGNLAAADADVWLLRTGIEGSRPVRLGEGGASLTPSFEIGLRLDGGDAETGMGADLGGGLAFADPKNGLGLDLKGRGLVAHESPGFREWGASLSVSWDPQPMTDRGLSLSLRQSWGASPAGGMDALLSRETLAGLAANDEDSGGRFEASSRLEGELGYGLPAFGGAFTGTPNVGFALSDGGAREWRLGGRLTSAVPGDPGFELNLDATRSEPANDNGPPEHGAMLKGTIRW